MNDKKTVYETGIEEGGKRWSVLFTPVEEIAFREGKRFGRNYIKRHGQKTERWNFDTQEWEEIL